MAQDVEGGDLVNWDGVLSPEERARILARIRSAFATMGTRMPRRIEIDGRQVALEDAVLGYLEKPGLSRADAEAAAALSEALERKVRASEHRIRQGELDETQALELMREVLGLLRALDHLRRVRDPRRAGPARAALLERVDDERRWREFLRSVK